MTECEACSVKFINNLEADLRATKSLDLAVAGNLLFKALLGVHFLARDNLEALMQNIISLLAAFFVCVVVGHDHRKFQLLDLGLICDLFDLFGCAEDGSKNESPVIPGLYEKLTVEWGYGLDIMVFFLEIN
jgi:hypothetical protein